MPKIRDEEIGDDCREEYSRDWNYSFPWFREYNEHMMLWLSHITVERPENPKEVPVIYQTPERAFADKLLPRVNARVDLPIISFVMTGTEFDRSRMLSYPTLVFDRTFQDGKYHLTPRPMPWNLNYNVTIWTKFQQDIDIIIYRILSRFTPSSYINPFGIASKVSFESHSDTSTLEPGEEGDRLLRHDLNFNVEGYMPLPSTEVGMIEQVNMVLTNDTESDLSDTNFDSDQDINIVEGEFIADDC
jgi:hypothetical protein